MTAEEDFRSLLKWAKHVSCGEMAMAFLSVSTHYEYFQQLKISHDCRTKDEYCDESPVPPIPVATGQKGAIWDLEVPSRKPTFTSLRLLKQTGRADLPSHQVRDDEDEFAHVEWFRQVSLIAGDKGALSILCPRERSESQRGNPTAPRFIGAQFPD